MSSVPDRRRVASGRNSQVSVVPPESAAAGDGSSGGSVIRACGRNARHSVGIIARLRGIWLGHSRSARAGDPKGAGIARAGGQNEKQPKDKKAAHRESVTDHAITVHRRSGPRPELNRISGHCPARGSAAVAMPPATMSRRRTDPFMIYPLALFCNDKPPPVRSPSQHAPEGKRLAGKRLRQNL